MKNKIKIGVIGLGQRGLTHFVNLEKNANFQVVAVCDLRLFNIKRRNILKYSDYKEMFLMCKELDAVVISLPTFLHFSVAMGALRAGLHVLIEKPFSLNISEANKLLAEAKKRNLVLEVGHHMIFDTRIKKIKKIIEENRLGKIIKIEAHQYHNWGEKRPPEWFLNSKFSGGGTIIDNATHLFSLFEYLLGPINSVYAVANNMFYKTVEDSAIISVVFLNNIIGLIKTSWVNSAGRDFGILIQGTRGVLELRDSNQGSVFCINKYKKDDLVWNQFESINLYLPIGIERRGWGKTNLVTPLENLYNSFAKNILSKKKVERSSVIKSINVVKLVEATYKSAKLGRLIRIR